MNRRRFLSATAAATTMTLFANEETEQNTYAGGLTDIEGIRVGHFTFPNGSSGCTAILCEAGAVAGVDIRGAAPGTRETDLLDPVKTVSRIHSIMLSGGSAYGLETAAGAMKYLEEKGVGYRLGGQVIPIVPAAIIFDLRENSDRPGKEEGYQACKNAVSGLVQEGSLGAGAGATVGKLLGMEGAMKGGVGSASIKIDDLVVAALAVVNAVGDVIDPQTGEILAGARKGRRSLEFADAAKHLRENKLPGSPPSGENTTLAVVATNARLEKPQATKLAQTAHDGFARAIRPVHTSSDGDTAFALSLGGITDFNLTQLSHLAAEATAQAIVRAVKTAEGSRGVPSYENRLQFLRRRGG